MLSVYAPTKYHDLIQKAVSREDRLHELVRIVDYLDERPIASAHSILVKQDAIWPLPDWHNLEPPYLLPEEIPFTAETLLGLIFAKLGNYEKTHEYLARPFSGFYRELDIINRLQQGIPVDQSALAAAYTPFDEYRIMHNQAIVHHYSEQLEQEHINKAKYYYLEALQAAPTDEYRAFTARHFALLLTDTNETADAARVLEAMLQGSISEEAVAELNYTLCQNWLQAVQVPYDQALLDKLKSRLWRVLETYQKQDRPLAEAMVLTDAGIIANYEESWSESLGYFNQAIAIFEAQGQEALAANAHYRKGTLLYTWAKNGNPQFYRNAAESYQQAARVFTEQNAPEVYAEIQHHLGIIYAEIPDEVKKKGIWAAVSSSAFQEALRIYRPEEYPYNYAAVCNHYGNALTKYPVAKLADNYEKALYYYEEALRIRSAEDFPLERSLTLLNYLEAQWFLGMPEDRFEADRYYEMVRKAEEVLELTNDTELRETAKGHLKKLQQLKTLYV